MIAKVSSAYDALSSRAVLATGNWSRMGDHFSGRGARLDMGEMLMLGAIVAIAGVGIWALNWAANREKTRRRKPSPRRLFGELCRTHGLNRRDRRLLNQLAEASPVETPGELFLRPELFERESLADAVKQDADELQAIARILFEEATPTPAKQHEKKTQPNDKQAAKGQGEQPQQIAVKS